MDVIGTFKKHLKDGILDALQNKVEWVSLPDIWVSRTKDPDNTGGAQCRAFLLDRAEMSIYGNQGRQLAQSDALREAHEIATENNLKVVPYRSGSSSASSASSFGDELRASILNL